MQMMLGDRSICTIIFVNVALSFLHVCISKSLIIGREKRYTESDACIESKNTLKEVDACPINKTSFDERSEIKNCRRYPTCAGETLAYHCVKSGRILVEVCAPINLITGRCCTFYDKKLGRVIEDYSHRCSQCPFQYQSDNCFILSECTQRITSDSTNENTTETFSTENSKINTEPEGDVKPDLEVNKTQTSMPNATSGDYVPTQYRLYSTNLIIIAVVISCLAVAIILIILIVWCRNRLTSVCFNVADWLKNIKTKKDSLKPQGNDKLHGESSEAMIKDECTSCRPKEDVSNVKCGCFK